MGVTVKKCHMIMSGNDCWNSVCFSCCRKADNELAVSQQHSEGSHESNEFNHPLDLTAFRQLALMNIHRSTRDKAGVPWAGSLVAPARGSRRRLDEYCQLLAEHDSSTENSTTHQPPLALQLTRKALTRTHTYTQHHSYYCI